MIAPDRIRRSQFLSAKALGEETHMSCVLFVSVNQSFNRAATLPQLEPWVERGWAISVAKASACDRVVAAAEGRPVAAWRLRGAYPTDETYIVGTSTRPRVGLSLGDPLPLLPEYFDMPALRHGVATKELPVADLTPDS